MCRGSKRRTNNGKEEVVYDINALREKEKVDQEFPRIAT